MRTIKTLICGLLLISTMLFAVGCNDEGFPVTVGKTTFESSPETVAVLSPNIADIIDCIGYDAKVSLVSNEVETKNMEYITKCGPAISPDIETIIDSQVKVVFADDNISDGSVKKLEDKEIKVVQFHYSNDNDGIRSTYKSVGTILGGVEGGKKGEKAFDDLLDTLKIYKDSVNKSLSNKKLIYLSGTSLYTTVIGDSWYNSVLNYSGVKSVSDDNTNPVVSLNEVASITPDYLVYDGKTYNSIKNKAILKSTPMIKRGHNTKLAKINLKLQGTTAVENIRKIVKMIDSKSIDKAEEKLVSNGMATTTTAPETTTVVTTTTKPVKTDTYELQSKYKVKFTKDKIKEMINGKTNDEIKAMQERFVDLGYLNKEYTTGFFGDLTSQAIKSFQKDNNMEETGTVTSELLQKLFSSKAKKKS